MNRDSSVTTPTPGRRAREDELRRRLILEAAERVFAERGFHEAGMADVARVAEFGVGTLYRFFADKDALYREVLLSTEERHLKPATAALDALSPLPPVERLCALVQTAIRRLESDRDAVRIFFRELHHPVGMNPELRETILHTLHNHYAGIAGRIYDIIVEGRGQGGFRADIDPAVATLIVLGAIDAVRKHLLLRGDMAVMACADLPASVARMAVLPLPDDPGRAVCDTLLAALCPARAADPSSPPAPDPR